LIVGSVTQPNGRDKAVMWQSGVMSDLPVPSDTTQSLASYISNQNQIVGFAEVGTLDHAVLWQNGAVTDLGVMTGFPNTHAQKINAKGQIVGTAQLSADTFHGVLWDNGAVTDLGPIVNLSYGNVSIN